MQPSSPSPLQGSEHHTFENVGDSRNRNWSNGSQNSSQGDPRPDMSVSSNNANNNPNSSGNTSKSAGPGMLAIPVVYQQAGWVITSLFLILFFIIASFSATMFCEAIDIVDAILIAKPQLRFKDRKEFSNIVRFYFGDVWYAITQLAFNISLQSLNIASIVVSAQAIDNLLIFLIGKVHALQFVPELKFVVATVSGEDIFGEGALVITTGYLLVLLLFIPFGFMELKENVYVQNISFWISLAMVLEFVWDFTNRPAHYDQTPLIGDNATQVVGVLVFAYAFTTLIPTWYNEKAPKVSTNQAIWITTSTTTVMYLVVGLLAAWAYPGVKTDNILNVMSRPNADVLTKACAAIFVIVQIAPGIPVRSIMLKVNLQKASGGAPESMLEEMSHIRQEEEKSSSKGSKKDRECCSLEQMADWCSCSQEWAIFWGMIFPYLVSFLFYEGKGFARFINWSSITINGSICFLVPFLVYIKAHALKQKLLVSPRDNVTLVEEEDEVQASLLLPTRKSKLPDLVALPCASVESPAPTYLAAFLLVLITLMLVLQVGVNVFYIVFAKKDVF